jgi:hypothetical protein
MPPAGVGAATAWSTPVSVTDPGATDYGGGWSNGEPMMAVSTSGTISVAFSSDYNTHDWGGGSCVPGSLNHYVGVFFEQSTDGGATWTTRVRMDPPTTFADRASLAQDGSTIGYVYVTQKCYAMNGTATRPRQLFFLASTDGGATWSAPRALSPARGRVDYPAIAMANGVIMITWTNSNDGRVMLARSTDGGSTFTKSRVGLTHAAYTGFYGAEGYGALPSLGFDGTYAVLSYTASNTGEVITRTSTDAGLTWSAKKVLVKSGSNLNASATDGSAASGRVGVSWTTKSGVYYREFDGTWGATHLVFATPSDGYASTQWAAPALFGSAQVGVAIPACKVKGCAINSTSETDLLWVESSDAGATWTTPTTLQANNSTMQTNTYPCVVWDPSTSTRYVAWTAVKSSWVGNNVFLTEGVG